MAVRALPSVLPLTSGRFRIRGLSPRNLATQRLVRWLQEQREVHDIRRREDGSIDVLGTESAEWRRSLADRIETALRRPPGPVEVRIVHHLPGRVRLRVSGGSDDDVLRLTAWLKSRTGVLRVSGSPASRSILVVYDRARTTADQLAADVRSSDPESWPAAPPPPPSPPWGNVAVSSVALAGAVGGWMPAGALSTLIAVSSIPVLERTLESLHERRIGVDALDLTAIGISLGTGQYTTSAFVTWLLSLGDILLDKAADRARRELTRLVRFETPEAWRLEPVDGHSRAARIPASRLRPGDHIVVSVGQRVAADGLVQSGTASLDEKALTGESEPRVVTTGARVLAATVVVEGEVVVEVHRVGGETTAAKIVQVLGSASAKPMTLQKNAERTADRLVLPAFGLAGASFALSGQIERATGVLIADFGTGLRISIPTCALAAVARAARSGVLVKGAQYLERLAEADVVIFDKTGTLTEGEPEINDVASVGSRTSAEVLALAAGAEAHATHPVAQALRRRAEREGVHVIPAKAGSLRNRVGRGLTATVAGHEVRVGSVRWMKELGIDVSPIREVLADHKARDRSSLLVVVDGRLEGTLSAADRPRGESAAVVRRLRANGRRRVLLFSGDSRATTRAIGEALEVDEAIGEMLPEDKAAAVKRLQAEGRVVAMVGDGINDAPALAHADVGISLHGGADVALETADVVLLRGGLESLPLAFDVSQEAMRSVRRSLWIVVIPNAAAIALASLGLLPSTVTAVINNGTTVLAALAGLAPLRRR